MKELVMWETLDDGMTRFLASYWLGVKDLMSKYEENRLIFVCNDGEVSAILVEL